MRNVYNNKCIPKFSQNKDQAKESERSIHIYIYMFPFYRVAQYQILPRLVFCNLIVFTVREETHLLQKRNESELCSIVVGNSLSIFPLVPQEIRDISEIGLEIRSLTCKEFMK